MLTLAFSRMLKCDDNFTAGNEEKTIDIITNYWRCTVRFYCVSGWHGRPVGVMVSCLRFLINNYILFIKCIIILIKKVGVMVSCLRFLMNSKNYTDKKYYTEGWSAPREPSIISCDVYGKTRILKRGNAIAFQQTAALRYSNTETSN